MPATGDETVDGHQIGSPLLTISCAACEPSGSLSPDASTTTTFVPDGTCESGEPLLEVRPPPDDGAVGGGVVPLSAIAGTLNTTLNANTINVLMERMENNLFFNTFTPLVKYQTILILNEAGGFQIRLWCLNKILNNDLRCVKVLSITSLQCNGSKTPSINRTKHQFSKVYIIQHQKRTGHPGYWQEYSW